MKKEYVAIMVLLISSLYIFCVTFVELGESGKDFAKTITGFILGTGFSTLINYYWGGTDPGKEPL